MHAVGQTEVEYTDLPIYRSQLASALGFDQSDLASNRAGRLGDGLQRRTLHRRLRNAVLGTLGFFVVGVLFLLLALTFPFTGRIVLNGILAFVTSLVGVGYFGWLALRIWLDVGDGEVSSIEGYVKQTDRETRTPWTSVWTFYWTVDGQRFAAGKAWAVLVPARHRLYYLPRSRRVVAAEPSA